MRCIKQLEMYTFWINWFDSHEFKGVTNTNENDLGPLQGAEYDEVGEDGSD